MGIISESGETADSPGIGYESGLHTIVPKTDRLNIVEFPSETVHERPAQTGAGAYERTKIRIREAAGRLLCRIGVPGVFQNGTIRDTVTGTKIDIQTGVFFTKLSVNGRDFYFCRWSGKYDGSGSGGCF